MWEAFSAFHICIACLQPELLRRPVVERAVWTFAVVQLGYKTPIEPIPEKSHTAGIPGMDRRFGFEAKRVAAAELLFAVCATNSTGRHRWRFQSGSSTLDYVAG